MVGTYGQKSYSAGAAGGLRGAVSADGSGFAGTWEEADGAGGTIRGDVALRMSSDGLSFEGLARVHGEIWTWEGTRIPTPPRVEKLDHKVRWFARVLCLRSQARLLLRDATGAMKDAACAVRLDKKLPEAWDAVSSAAAEMNDKRTSVIALSELWFLQPSGSKNIQGMSASLASRRRQQGLELEKLKEGTEAPSDADMRLMLNSVVGSGPAPTAKAAGGAGGVVAPVGVARERRQVEVQTTKTRRASSAGDGGARERRMREEEANAAKVARAIFSDEYVLPEGEEGDPFAG